MTTATVKLIKLELSVMDVTRITDALETMREDYAILPEDEDEYTELINRLDAYWKDTTP